jgi:prevent-host-death family protein
MNMSRTINAKQLRAELSEIARRAQRGERFTVLYRSRPAFQIVPIDEGGSLDRVPLTSDPLYQAPPVGRSTDGLTSRDHDQILYGATKT